MAEKRPSAAQVIELLEGEEGEVDNSILCVNMIQAEEEEEMDEDDESIICLDDISDTSHSTPSAV